MTDPEIEKAERNLFVMLLTALADKRVIGAVVAAVVALSSYVAYWTQSHTTVTMGAVSADPCNVKGRDVTNANQQACIAILCAHLGAAACTPTPPKPPDPTSIGGSAATGGASSVGGSTGTGGTTSNNGLALCIAATKANPGRVKQAADNGMTITALANLLCSSVEVQACYAKGICK